MCRYCGSPSINGEGVEVCRACVYRRGAPVRNPEKLTIDEVNVLMADHSTVTLIVSGGRGQWVWDSAWPRDNHTLLPQGSNAS